MNFRMITAAGLVLALAGCTTTGGLGSPLKARWVGKPAGVFFAAYGPPLSDVETGSTTIYDWRGGYKKARIPAQYAAGENGKKGKQIAPARTDYLRCEVKLSVGSDYTIRDIQAVVDKPGASGPSYCAEFLDAQK